MVHFSYRLLPPLTSPPQESKVGLAVGKLRQYESAKVATAAKDLVKKWRNAVDKSKTPKHTPTPATRPSAINTSNLQGGSRATVAGTPATPTSSGGAPRTAKSDGVSGGIGDKVRDKCLELVYDALASDSSARTYIHLSNPSHKLTLIIATDLVLRRATEVERAVFVNQGNTTANDYRGKIRSLFVNLKDKNNPELRAGVVSGEVAVERFVVMTSEEMASEEQRAALKKIKDENLFNALSAKETEAETTAFQCSKCKQVRVSAVLRASLLILFCRCCRENAGIGRHRREAQMSR